MTLGRPKKATWNQQFSKTDIPYFLRAKRPENCLVFCWKCQSTLNMTSSRDMTNLTKIFSLKGHMDLNKIWPSSGFFGHLECHAPTISHNQSKTKCHFQLACFGLNWRNMLLYYGLHRYLRYIHFFLQNNCLQLFQSLWMNNLATSTKADRTFVFDCLCALFENCTVD